MKTTTNAWDEVEFVGGGHVRISHYQDSEVVQMAVVKAVPGESGAIMMCAVELKATDIAPFITLLNNSLTLLTKDAPANE